MNHRPLVKNITGALLLVAVSTSAIATERDSHETSARGALEIKPKWEIGVGGGYLEGFDYPASKNSNRFGGLLPFAIYRSEKLRFTGRGLSAIALEDSRNKLDVSMAVSLNAETEGNELREGMPDLDYLFEIGPQLVTRLIDTETKTNRTKLNWSNRVRAVFSTDFGSLDSRGWVVQSQFQWRRERLFSNKVDLFSTLSFTWASEKLQDYFYEVDQQFQTQSRPSYDAKSGYLGTTLFTGFGIRPVPDFRFFLGVNYGYYGATANQNSPLFETRSSTGIAVGIIWTLVKSKKTIRVLDDE